MGLLLSFYLLIKYFFSIIFKGPLNFSVEILFYIFNGILFGPFKGSIHSILADTLFQIMSGQIGFWMIEYAIVAPLLSIMSWTFWKLYKDNNKWTIVFSIITIVSLLVLSLSLFFFQLFNNNFYYENSKNVLPIVIYILISFLSSSIIIFLVFCLIRFKQKKDWKYIKWLYTVSLVILSIVIFRWLWGPFAFIQYMKRFISPNIDVSKQYIMTLFGIVTKSYISIPLMSIVLIPSIYIVGNYRINNNLENRFI